LGFWGEKYWIPERKTLEQGFCSDTSRHGDKWRAGRDVQKQQTPFLLFRSFGGRSEFSKRLLSTCLITVYALKPTGTSHRWDWT